MAVIPEDILGAITRHQVYVGRYSTSVANRMIKLLNRVDTDLLLAIAAAIEKSPESFSAQRLDRLLASERALLAELYKQVDKELAEDLKTFAAHEAEFNVRLLNRAAVAANVAVSLSAVDGATVYSAAMARPFQGVLLREALSGVEAGVAKKVRDAIRMGIIEGRTTDQIVRTIRGTKANGYADGFLDWGRRSVDSVVRTAINHTSNVARQTVYEANDDILQGWMFVATLDSRTTITCASLSGKIYPIGKGPMPPRHYNCRSTSVPVLEGQTEFFGTRASKDGYVDANLSFSDWLRNQPKDVQDDILGPVRADLFRAKKIEIDRFTDPRGNVLSMEELRKKDAELFA